MNISRLFAVIFVLFQISLASAGTYRWTKFDDTNSDFNHVIEVLNTKSGQTLSASDFLLIEDRALANNYFRMYVQSVAGTGISETSIRLWTDLKTKELIQAEAMIADPELVTELQSHMRLFSSTNNQKSVRVQAQLSALVKKEIKKHADDPNIRDMKTRDLFENGILIRIFTVKGKYGKHIVKVSINGKKIISAEYKEFAHADTDNTADEFSVPALVFPVYEIYGSHIQQRVVSQLKYLNKKTPRANGKDPYALLKSNHYYDKFFDPILGLTPAGQAQGYWSMADIKAKAASIRLNLPTVANTFTNGVLLEGRYATINIHPDAKILFGGLTFAPAESTVMQPQWKEINLDGEDSWEMVPGSGFLGRPLASFEDAYNRPARYLPDHNPTEYLNDGFDEVQVYWAINTLFDSLHLMGFKDPELSTRPFHAYLYDPDINSRDNAYYTDDTINFTTYSPGSDNAARDNGTIWHELGHGVMDRLMGDYLHLADTGGLSEGMADFVAALVIEKVTGGRPFEGSDTFRIINNMGFHLTNEVHDDGESYGGAMRDLMVAAKAKFGAAGVDKVGDLTMEAMRLTRNHPALTAEEWFDHMVFADQLGHEPIRRSGELKDLILSSLGSRNFVFGTQSPAQFVISHNGKPVDSGSDGSRQRPIPVTLAATETATYPLEITVKDGDVYKFQFPMTIRVGFEGGPLQGAINWVGQEKRYVDYTINSAADALKVDLTMTGVCDEINRPDGSCSDFAYIQVLQKGLAKPVAKKRFYLRLTTKP